MFDRREEPGNAAVTAVQKARDVVISLDNCFQKLFSEATGGILQAIETRLALVQTQLAKMQTCAQGAIEQQVESAAADVSAELRCIKTAQLQLASSVCGIEKQLQSLIMQNTLLENASKESGLLTEEHYQQCIVQPMVRSLFPAFDEVEEAKRRSFEAGPMNSTAVCDVFDAILIHLRQFLSTYQVESIRHSPDTKFDPKLMRPVKIIATGDKTLNGCIAASLRTGFRWREENLLRPESVAVYRYEFSFNHNLNDHERSSL